MNFKELKQQYNQSLKSMDTEEHIDLWFYRPLGFAWAVLFAKLGISPNIVTIASIFLGVGGGILLYFGAEPLIWLNYVGIFLIIWANTYDSADGQLARITKQYSQIGRILDGVSGDLWFFAIYFALVFRELHFGDAWLGDFFQQSQNHWITSSRVRAAASSRAPASSMSKSSIRRASSASPCSSTATTPPTKSASRPPCSVCAVSSRSSLATRWHHSSSVTTSAS